jgi:formylglycine-generating enzyme required for sulfatase activity
VPPVAQGDSPRRAGPPAEVPAPLLERLRAQYVPEEAAEPAPCESDKIRRYRAILREGAWAERRYAGAPNLYRLLELMLAAAKGLATLEGTEESRRDLLAIVRRVAASDAPPEARLPADLLLARARIDELGDAPAENADEIEWFLDRYDGTAAAPQALMAAAELGGMAGAGPTRREALRRLGREHLGAPGVSEFLEVQGLSPYVGRLMTATLTRLDGSPLVLPRDLLGQTAVLHFWSLEKPGLVSRRGVAVKATHEKLSGRGLRIVGINLDLDRAKVARFVQEQDLPWVQTSSGLAGEDPTFRHFRVPTLPAYWLIAPDGRAIANNYAARPLGHIEDWAGFGAYVERNVDWLRESAARVPYYRSGEFLLDVPQVFPPAAPAAGVQAAADLAAIRDHLFLPPSLGLTPDRKAERLREALRLGQAAESRHAEPQTLAAIRNGMLVAARWLATERRDSEAAAQARQIAGRVLASGAEGGRRLLADFVRTSADLAAPPPAPAAGGNPPGAPPTAPERVADRIRAFVAAYEGTDVRWAAAILGVILAVETGDETARSALVNQLGAQAPAVTAKVRGFLRDFCCANVDARTTTFQYHPLLAMAAGGEGLPADVRPLRQALVRLDGGTFRLPEDAAGKLVALQFWSVACPPEPQPLAFQHKTQEYRFDRDVLIVGVNLDASRRDVEAFLKDKKEFANWIHVFSGKGWDDPLARQVDVYGLPRALLLDGEGAIYRWGTPVQLGDAVQRALAGPPAWTARAPSTTLLTDSPAAGTPAAELPKDLTLDPGAGAPLRLVLLGPAEFRMGSPQAEMRRFHDEWPQRTIRLTRPFYVAVHPVTRGQFGAFVKDSGYATEAEREGWALVWSGGRWEKVEGASWRKPGFDQDDDHPVVSVSWNDAVEFCQWLSRRSGRTVRLPTEAQWEYACRADVATLYPWGDDPEAGAGWCNAADQAGRRASPRRPAHPGGQAFAWDDGYPFTSPVGRFKANAFGLFDAIGNVWQWTADWSDRSYLWEAPGHWKPSRTDPTGPDSGAYRVTRGGSWHAGPPQCRLASRRIEPPALRHNALGFRVAADPP